MLVNAINIKNQKDVFRIDITFKSNELTKANCVMESELKRLIINIDKNNSKVILLKKNVIDFEKSN